MKNYAWSFLNECHDDVPEGIRIKRGTNGYYGMYATKTFSKGSVLYRGRTITIPNIYKEYDLILKHADGAELIIPCNTDTHCVQFSETELWLYLFDGFMNHSCDPTTISERVSDSEEDEYDTIALRDIQPGEEITCDYNLFEYDGGEKSIDVCLCGSTNCLGRIAGFRYLSLDQQKERINLVDVAVLNAMSSDKKNKFVYIQDLKCPKDRVLLIESTDDDSTDTSYRKLVAARDFYKGDIVYSNESILIPHNWSIVVQIDRERIWVDHLVHTINKGNGLREYYFFDSFRNHSCDPNTCVVYKSETMYDVIATTDIKIGDELTIDYEVIDPGFDDT